MALDDAYPTGVTQLETTAQWEAFLGGYGTDGVIPGVDLEMSPFFDTGTRTAGVAPGAAQIRGFHVNGPTHTSVPIPDPDAQNRIDRIVLRLDRAAATAAGWVTAAVLTGTPAAAPSPPALTQTPDGIYEIPMARWTSESNGSLTGFADERVFAAAAPVEFPPWARPPATLRRIGFERYTGRVMYADGTAWQPIFEDTGWVEMSVDWPSAWRKVATCAARRVTSTVSFSVQVARNGPLAANDPDGSRLVTLPEGMRPVHHYVYWVGQFTSGVSGRMYVGGDGAVWIDRLSDHLGGDEYLRVDMTFLV